MEFKLLGLEMITKMKEANYKRGLRQRIAIFAHYLGMQQMRLKHSIVPQFSRDYPEFARTCHRHTILKARSHSSAYFALPFVEDPDAGLEEPEEEKEKNRDRVPFFNQANTG